MKKILLGLVLMLGFTSTNVTAQTFYSCTEKVYCYYNDETEEFDNCDEYIEESSLFEVNETMTVFIHTTESMKSTYYVRSTETLDSGLIIYHVISDVGNEYSYVFDDEYDEIRCLIVFSDDSMAILGFTIKSIF
jgi:hypothetical protein